MSVVGVLSSFLSFLAGLWSASYLQDRETRRRHLGIVRALKAEVGRIRRESGGQGDHHISITVLGMRAAVPKLSPWVPSILTDIASTSPEVVEGFLNLERYLDNLRTFDTAGLKVQEHLEAKKGTAEQAEKDYEKVSLDNLGEAMVELTLAEREKENAEDAAELADFAVETAFTNVRTTVDDLFTLLSRLERSLARGFWTHLPWRQL
jgi:hypothetical protein